MNVRKAFDFVHQGTLLELLSLRKIPRKIIELIRSLYLLVLRALSGRGDASELFPVKTGERQGCVLAPSLFTEQCSASVWSD